ncbi:MAG: hypothetical protein O9301_00540 [Leptospira sp.]|nr:hypothetical protein [Leptospira sp.]
MLEKYTRIFLGQRMFAKSVSRKKFLIGSFGALGLYFVLSPYLGKSLKTLFLSKNQSKVIWLYLSALLPPSYETQIEYRNTLIQRMDEELYFVNDSIQGEFDSALLLVEFYPWILGNWSSFSKLKREEALECIQKGIQSKNLSVRAAFSSLRMLCYLIHYGQKESWKDIQYEGPFAAFPEKISETRAYYKEQIGA